MDKIWNTICKEAEESQANNPELSDWLDLVVCQRGSLEESLGYILRTKLSPMVSFNEILMKIDLPSILAKPKNSAAIRSDLLAILNRDPAVNSLLIPFLYFKGFHVLQCYRIAHDLWMQKRRHLAYMIQNQVSLMFSVDIHPAAQIGKGILIDHATGIVIGETSVLGDDISIMQSVTLGGTGKIPGDRHPKICHGVLLGAGAIVLGNIEIGIGAKVAAGSVVLKNVGAYMSVAGIPAKVIGQQKKQTVPAINF